MLSFRGGELPQSIHLNSCYQMHSWSQWSVLASPSFKKMVSTKVKNGKVFSMLTLFPRANNLLQLGLLLGSSQLRLELE